MASFWSFFATFMVFMAYFSSPAFTSRVHVQFSTISAAPAFLPEAPLSSPPSLSPDIEPVFPTTGAGVPSPAESSLPTIPSSPSPPNPDLIEPAAGPVFAMSPSGALPDSAATSLSSPGPLNLAVCFLGFLGFCFMQLSAL
ncbi:classical arabinogalactan protein 26 [Manihot esculenta]|uniref:Classical arabinogalactan protein 26 n=1 Tax=Manihot esculenta TaxID=3983 RepID=A0A2C9VVE4_MANES|nr:classical arabinogalactan protein 26 [Manihot esculenta]